MPSPAFWSGKRVFLTGHTGFKGAWLSLWLQQLGAQVYGFALEPETEPNLFSLASLGRTLVHTVSDLRDVAAVRAAMSKAQPDIVLHLAAQALVRRSYDQPIETFASNVMGTAHVLDAIRDIASVKAAVVITTDKCYENREWVWPYRENDPLGGHDPYSSSKACAEIVTSAYRNSFLSRQGVALATARAGNVIGGGDWAEDRLLPDCIRSFQRKEKVVIRNPVAVRPWQHVLEPLAGYLVLAEKLYCGDPACAEAFNFGPTPDDVRPVSWVVSEAARLWGKDAAWELDRSAQPHEAQLLALDASKARSVLSWRPRLTLSDCLEWTVDWYRTVAGGKDARVATMEQIERYRSLEFAP